MCDVSSPLLHPETLYPTPRRVAFSPLPPPWLCCRVFWVLDLHRGPIPSTSTPLVLTLFVPITPRRSRCIALLKLSSRCVIVSDLQATTRCEMLS
jgi:hypothetical protein